MAILEVETTDPSLEGAVGSLPDLIGATLQEAGPYDVITASDIRSLLGLEAQRQLLGCADDSSCLAEIGGALGAAYLLRGRLVPFGERLVLTLSVIDTEVAKPVHRHTEAVDRIEALLPAARRSAEAVARAIARQRGLDLGRPPAPASRQAAPVLGWVALGAGGLLAAGGAGLVYHANGTLAALAEQGDPEARLRTRITYPQAEGALLQRQVGVGLVIGGAAVAAASYLVFFVLDGTPTHRAEGPMATLAPLPGGLGVVGQW